MKKTYPVTLIENSPNRLGMSNCNNGPKFYIYLYIYE